MLPQPDATWLQRDNAEPWWLAVKLVAEILCLSLAYWIAARLGLTLALVHGQVTPIWPPSGIALAFLLLGGLKLWPGVLIGAFLANLAVVQPWAALAVGLGNTLEALLGAYLFRGYLDRGDCHSLRGVRRFALVAAPAGAAVAASVGAMTLLGVGLVPPEELPAMWLIWALADLVGILIVAPLIVCWAKSAKPLAENSWFEVVLLSALLGFVLLASFGFLPLIPDRLPLAFLPLPFLGWAAVRLSQRAAVTATTLCAVVAIWATLHGHGPFTEDGGMILLQMYLAIMPVPTLLLSAMMHEREQLSAELAEAKRLADTAVDAKTRLLRSTHHDLRQPMVAAQMFAAAMGTGEQCSRCPSTMTHLRSSLDTMDAMITALRDASQLETATIAPQIEVMALGPFLRQLKAEFAPQAARKGLELRMAERSLRVVSDPQLLGRILRNYLSNAIRYTRCGKVLLGCRRCGGILRIEVRDTGPGIPLDKQKLIFDEFQRLDPQADSGGMGLGLANVERMARLLSHPIGLDSAPGRGSLFWIEVPVAH